MQAMQTQAQEQVDLKALSAYCFDTLIAALDKKDLPKYPEHQPDPHFPIFVTWTKGADKDLRGCIGTFAEKRLSKVLPQYTLISAFKDSRFSPIQKPELPHLHVGLSLLTNFTEIDDPLNWEVGKHGIEIDFKAQGRDFGGTFLPEVAKEQGWDQKTTLEYLVRKAGYQKGFESVRESIRAKTYESLKSTMSFSEYQEYRKQF